MKNNCQIDITIKVRPKKKGNAKIERYLEKECAVWIRFLLSESGQKVMKLLGEGKSSKLKVVEDNEIKN